MRRALLPLLIGAALLATIPAQAFWQSRDSNYNAVGGPAPLAFTSLANGVLSGSPIAGSGTYSGTAPASISSATWTGCGGGSSTPAGFSAGSGTWSATFTVPGSAGSGCTIGITDNRTATATSPGVTISSPFTGPLDVVASPTVLYSLRAGSTAIATAGTQTIANIRRASDNVACDFLPALSGGLGVTSSTCNSSTQGGVSYSTFVGSDGTASCTLAGTTGACSGASGTVHINDVVTGAGLTQPCIVTTASNTAPVLKVAETASTSCGTVGAAVTFTFQVAGFVHTLYDQSGNTKDAVETANAAQPQFLPACLNSATLPCVAYPGGTATHLVSSAFTTVAQPYTFIHVSERTANFAANNTVLATGPASFGGSPNTQSGYSAANTAYGGNTSITAAAADSAAHAIQIIFNGGSSTLNVDGSATAGTIAATASNTVAYLGIYSGGVAGHNGYTSEFIIYPIGLSAPQQASMHTNQSAWFGTP